MTIKLRFGLLLSLLLGGLVIALLVLQQLERAETANMMQMDRQARAQLLHHWIDATSRALPQFASDLAQSDELAAVLRQNDRDAARAKLAAAVQAAGASWLWLARDDGTLILDVAAPGVDPAAALPIAAADFTTLINQTPNPRFFADTHLGLVEVCIRRLQTPPAAESRAWLVVARSWDDRQLRALSALTDGKVSLEPPHRSARGSSEEGQVEIVRPLTDWQGHPLRVLQVQYEVPEIERAVQSSARQSWVFIAFGLLLLVGLGLALQGWVLRPLRQISESLATQKASVVDELTTEKSEFGRVAELVRTSFGQRAALELEVAERRRTQEALERSEASLRRNLEERARLGRDLHDGVIQSLYAAGMGLAGIRMQLRPEQTEAATRLEQTRAALNETIHDVRNFIIGLEPEALKLQSFSQAIAALLDVMRGMGQFRSVIEVDDALAARLTLAQRVHALQIAREAVSNALRHGQASHIGVSLRRAGEFASFEVIDNGQGFDPASAPTGKGLTNFTQRARELGGELIIESRLGHGTRVNLMFSPTL